MGVMARKSDNGLFRTGLLFGAGLIVAFIVFAAVTGQSKAQTQNAFTNTAVGANQAGVQVIKAWVESSEYKFSQSEFKKGVPVRLEFDMNRVYGCSRSIVIPQFGISKLISESDNVIEFTPDKAGTFNIACSMNMYRGTFTVLQNDGSKADFVEKQAAPSGGGCGCGGGSAGGSGTCGV